MSSMAPLSERRPAVRNRRYKENLAGKPHSTPSGLVKHSGASVPWVKPTATDIGPLRGPRRGPLREIFEVPRPGLEKRLSLPLLCRTPRSWKCFRPVETTSRPLRESKMKRRAGAFDRKGANDDEGFGLDHKGSSSNCGVFSGSITGGRGARRRQSANDRPLEFQPGPERRCGPEGSRGAAEYQGPG